MNTTIQNLGVSDVQLVISCAILLLLAVVVAFLVYKAKGASAVRELILQAEYIFDWKGSGKEKANYVLEKARTLVPAPYRWFLSLEFISRLVSSMQPTLKDMEKERKDNAVV